MVDNTGQPLSMDETTGDASGTSSLNIVEHIAEGRCNGEILVFCERDSEVHILSITKEGTLGDVYGMLKEKWSDICPENTTLHYFDPDGGFRVELKSNSDVEHMYCVHELMKKGTCKILACRVASPNKRTWYDEPMV